MKRFLIGGGVVAAMLVASNASAYEFRITGANLGNAATTLSGNGFTAGAATLDGKLQYVQDFSGAASQTHSLTTADVATLSTMTGLVASASNQVNYFGFVSGGVGYFGIAVTGSAAFSVSMNGAANAAANGVYTNATLGASSGWNPSGSSVNLYEASSPDASAIRFFIFAGLPQNSPATPDGSLNGIYNGSVSDGSNMTVRYLTFDGTSYDALGGHTWGGSGITSSGMTGAAYVVPVPAPAALAAAGLVGALALRRRQIK
jgi:MYXO-CTERM domain-containing protein